MAYNGSGTYALYTPGNPVVAGTTIDVSWGNNTLNDIATALSTAICKDGQTTTTASIPFVQGIAVSSALTTPSTTFAIANTTATTVNFAGGATVAINVGGAGNTTTWTATLFTHSGRMSINDQTNRTEGTAQATINGSGYNAYHWMDGTAYYIGQGSAIRSIRMYSGVTPTTGVELTNGATSWASTSDERLKDIIEPITGAKDKLKQLRTVVGRYKTDSVDRRRSFLIGQDVQRILPEAVYVHEDGMISVRYQDIIPLLIAAINEP